MNAIQQPIMAIPNESYPMAYVYSNRIDFLQSRFWGKPTVVRSIYYRDLADAAVKGRFLAEDEVILFFKNPALKPFRVAWGTQEFCNRLALIIKEGIANLDQ